MKTGALESSLKVSLFWHFIAAMSLVLIFNYKPKTKVQVLQKFEVIEFPKEAPEQVLSPELPVAKKPTKVSHSQPVFGLSKKAWTSDTNEAGVSVKEGNTLAKAPDDLKLDKEDTDSLPIPTDDYLIQVMPKILKEVRAQYPEEAKQDGISGKVELNVLIDEKGDVRKVELVKGPGKGLNESALEAVKQFKFSPAIANGKPVAVKIKYIYRFTLESGL